MHVHCLRVGPEPSPVPTHSTALPKQPNSGEGYLAERQRDALQGVGPSTRLGVGLCSLADGKRVAPLRCRTKDRPVSLQPIGPGRSPGLCLRPGRQVEWGAISCCSTFRASPWCDGPSAPRLPAGWILSSSSSVTIRKRFARRLLPCRATSSPIPATP